MSLLLGMSFWRRVAGCVWPAGSARRPSLTYVTAVTTPIAFRRPPIPTRGAQRWRWRWHPNTHRKPGSWRRLSLSGPPRWYAPRDQHRAANLRLLTAGKDGIELLEQSVAVLEPTPMRLALAHSLTELGATLRRAGARTAAREPLRRALDLAARCGATPLAARARDEALATGARPRRPRTPAYTP
jgi:hypothetical protein